MDYVNDPYNPTKILSIICSNGTVTISHKTDSKKEYLRDITTYSNNDEPSYNDRHYEGQDDYWDYDEYWDSTDDD